MIFPVAPWSFFGATPTAPPVLFEIQAPAQESSFPNTEPRQQALPVIGCDRGLPGLWPFYYGKIGYYHYENGHHIMHLITEMGLWHCQWGLWYCKPSDLSPLNTGAQHAQPYINVLVGIEPTIFIGDMTGSSRDITVYGWYKFCWLHILCWIGLRLNPW